MVSRKKIFRYFPFSVDNFSGIMWYVFCFGTAVGSGDIEVVVMQGKVSTLKHNIDRHNREYIDKIKRAIETIS